MSLSLPAESQLFVTSAPHLGVRPKKISWVIPRNPELSWDIRDWGYLMDIWSGYQRISFWISKDILLGYERIFMTYPLISSLYPLTYPKIYLFISNNIPSYPCISLDIHTISTTFIFRYPLTYPLISVDLSYAISWDIYTDIQELIHGYPSTYPSDIQN